MVVSAFDSPLMQPDRPFRILDSYTRNTLFKDRSLWLDPYKKIPAGAPPFDSFHYAYYADRAAEPAVEVAREQTILDHGCMEIAQGGLPMLYRPFSITGGVESHKLAVAVDNRQQFLLAGKKKAFLRTTRDMHLSQAGRERLAQDVINQNKRDAEYLNQHLRHTFPDYALVDPFDKEGAVRINRLDADASFGRAPQEEDFMGGWYRLVDHSQGMVWTPNVAFSRNGNWEEMRGIFAAIGSLNGIVRDKADYKVFRIDRSYSPFAERLQYNLDYLLFAADNDFHAGEAATCAAWKLEIARRLMDPAYNAESYHPIDMQQIDPMLRAEFTSQAPWAITSRARIEAVRDALEPLLLGHFAGHIQDAHMRPLDARYYTARTNIARPFTGWAKTPAVVDDARQRLADLDIYRTADPADPALIIAKTPKEKLPTLGAAFRTMATPRQMAHKDNVFDTEKCRSKIFEDDDYARVTKRERVVLQRILGAMMTVALPTLAPAYTLVLADLEKGTYGLKAARADRVTDLNQLRETIANPQAFATRIEKPNFATLSALESKVRKDTANSAAVISTAQLVGLQQAYAWLPHITAVAGYGPTSPEFRMALRLKLMDMATDTVVLERDWAPSDDHVRHVVRATLIQMGLVARGHMHPTDLVLKDHALKPMTFLDRFVPIMMHLEKCVANGVKSRAHALGALRLLECHEILVEPSVRAGLVDVGAVHESLLADRIAHTSRKGMDARYVAAREFIFTHCIDWLDEQDLKDLNADVRAAWFDTRGRKAVVFTPAPNTTGLAARLGPKLT